MSIRHKTIAGAAWLSAGRVGGQAISLARNIILARLIGPEHLGVAATFAITLSFLEAVSTISVDRLLVQAKEGDDERFQRTAQAAQALRGAMLGATLCLCSWALAALFDSPGAIWAYQAIALVPVMRGLAHLDTKRLQRDMNFAPDVKVEILLQTTLLALVWPMSAWLRDYRAAACLTIVSGCLYCVFTHAISRRRYGWSWDPAFARRIMVFGWPLLVNGILMFLILQGDQFIIGSAERLFGSPYTHNDLGQFAAAAGLALAAQSACASVAASLFLPLLSRVQDDSPRFRVRYALCLEGLTVIATVLGAAGVVAGPVLVTALYGAKFETAGRIFPWIMAMQMVRLLRVPPTLAAMARADTAATMLANLARVLGFAGAVLVASRGGSLEAIAIAGLGAEALACLAALARLESRAPLGWATSAVPMMAGALSLSAALMAGRWTVRAALGEVETLALAAMIGAVCIPPLLAVFPAVRQEMFFLGRRLLQSYP